GPGSGRVRRVRDRLFPDKRSRSFSRLFLCSDACGLVGETNSHVRRPMSHSAVPLENETTAQDPPGRTEGAAIRCSLPVRLQGLDAVSSDLCDALEEAGCPLAPPVRVRVRLPFETLLAGLSATFINLSAGEVDSQIESALQRLVEFLEVDRGGLAE